MCYSVLIKQDFSRLGVEFGASPVREQIDRFNRASENNPKKFPAVASRIYPGHYAAVIFSKDESKLIELMRYSAYPPPAVSNPSQYTTFNARRDNLTSSFWENAFRKHHGFIVIEAFYEWVAVKDLLRAKVVSLDEVKAEFAMQAEERKKKILAQGKKYKPTPTEMKDPQFRQIIIEFKPEDGKDLLVPVIYSSKAIDDQFIDKGFAIVTDDPPREIAEAGHSRCPVILEPSAIQDWLNLSDKSAEVLDSVLTRRKRVTFRHQIAKVA